MDWYEGWSSDDNLRKIADDRAMMANSGTEIQELVNTIGTGRLSGGEQDNCPPDRYLLDNYAPDNYPPVAKTITPY